MTAGDGAFLYWYNDVSRLIQGAFVGVNDDGGTLDDVRSQFACIWTIRSHPCDVNTRPDILIFKYGIGMCRTRADQVGPLQFRHHRASCWSPELAFNTVCELFGTLRRPAKDQDLADREKLNEYLDV